MAGGRLWTSDEDTRLRSAWSEFVDDPDRGTVSAFDERIGQELDRPKGSVTQRRAYCELQLKAGGAQGRPINPAGLGHGVIDQAKDLDLLEYTYADGMYYFPVAGKIFPIPEPQWERICEMYSAMGENRTAVEAARELDLPVQVLRRCLRQADQYKASLPVSREALVRDGVEAIAERTLVAKERQVVAAHERKWRSKMEREYLALKMRLLDEQRFVDSAEQIVGSRPVPNPPRLKTKSARGSSPPTFTVHAPTTDEHVGLLVWGNETGGGHYDTTLAAQRLMSHADAAVGWVADQPGRCETAYRTFLGDFFHALTGMTEHGTPLHQDSRPAKVFDAGLEAVEYSVQRFRQVADRVVVAFCPGNHDGRETLFTFFRAVERSFKGCDDVAVRVHPGRYTGFRVGSALHVLDHGYGIAEGFGWKGKAQAEVVARAFGPDFEGAETIYTYTGHMHNRAVGQLGDHHTLIRLEALTEPDDYATDLRYRHRPAARLFRLDADGRIETERVLYAATL